MEGPQETREAQAAPTVRDVDDLLVRLLHGSHELAPDALTAFVAQEVQRAGFAQASIYLADHDQVELRPLLARERDPLPIDASVAGLAYRMEGPVEAAGETPGARKLWLPLRDGIQRVGVMCVEAVRFDEELTSRCMALATLVTGLVVSKTQYGDRLVLARRRGPLSLPAELRWSMLPPLSFATPTLSLACAVQPPYTIAGDAFDYAFDDGRLHFAIFDAMGHGLEAARMANLAVGAYRHCRRTGVDLAETYGRIGDVIASEFGPDHFVTAYLAVLEASTGVVEAVNAGHPPPILLRRGRTAREVESVASPPLAVANEPLRVDRLALEPDDRLVVYTDGVVDARSQDGQPFGTERLVDVIVRSISERHSGPEAVRRLVHAVLDHLDGPPQDDAAIALVSWARPDPRPSLQSGLVGVPPDGDGDGDGHAHGRRPG